MDAWWIAPVVVLLLSGAALLVAGGLARRSTRALAADRPAVDAVRVDLLALHGDLARVADRVDGRHGGAGPGTPDR
jgi:hypothetical protein